MKINDLLFENNPPNPVRSDLEDAIGHADIDDRGWKVNDFKIEYEGYLSIDDIRNYDDIDSWIDAHDPEDLEDFRNGKFMNLKKEPNPIIVIVTPEDGGCHEQVGDGRGRVNYANATDSKLHVYKMTHKNCVDKEDSNED